VKLSNDVLPNPLTPLLLALYTRTRNDFLLDVLRQGGGLGEFTEELGGAEEVETVDGGLEVCSVAGRASAARREGEGGGRRTLRVDERIGERVGGADVDITAREGLLVAGGEGEVRRVLLLR
jgi:hypothetical protein